MNKDSIIYRARIAYNAILNNADYGYDHMPYQNTFFNSSPVENRHLISGLDWGEIPGRFMIAILLAKNMLNINETSPVEEIFLNQLCKTQDMYGNMVASQPGTEFSPEYKIAPWGEPQRMLFEAFLLKYQMGEHCYKERLDKFIDGVIALEDDWKLINRKDDQMMTDFNLGVLEGKFNPYATSWLLSPLTTYYKLIKDEKVMMLMDKIIKEHPILHDENFIKTGEIKGHVHTQLSGICGLLQYAILTNNDYIKDKCIQSYEWFLNEKGSTVGWFPELVNDGTPIQAEDCETCVISNMIEIALILANITNEDKYWNDAECFIKNQLMEQQLLDVDWIPFGLQSQKRDSDGRRSFDDVLTRSVGIFQGNAAVNDFVGNNPPCNFRSMSGCCTAWGIRALYLAWHNAITKDSDGIYSINMRVDRDCDALKVRSYEPYEGKFKIITTKKAKIRVKLPTWASRNSRRFRNISFSDVKERWGANWIDTDFIKCTVNGKKVNINSNSLYMDLGELDENTVVIFTYPLKWDKYEEEIGGRKYMLEWLGNHCINIEPKGLICPLYQRSNMKKSYLPYLEYSILYPEKEFIF